MSLDSGSTARNRVAAPATTAPQAGQFLILVLILERKRGREVGRVYNQGENRMVNQQDISGIDPLQRAFGACESYRTAFSENCATFWRGQDKILDSMQEFASGWFTRRHEGAKSAIEAAHRIGVANSPADAMREWQHWMTSSMQRVTADGVACQKHLMTVAECNLSAAATASHAPEFTSPPRPAPDSGPYQRARAA